MAHLLYWVLCCFLFSGQLHAQLNQNCVVSILNRTVQVNPDGSWVIPNVPSNIGQVRARATCVNNGVTTSGQSDFFTVPTNGIVGPIGITFGTLSPVPQALTVTAPATELTSAGQSVQLTVTSTFVNAPSRDLTPHTAGTNYSTSNPAVATVSPDGLVKAVASGTAIISVLNEGALGVIAIQVVLSGTSHGGIPDSWAIAHGLNPNDPAMPFEDPDHDGLNNLQEFQYGTDPHNPSTAGDGIPDGLAVQLGFNPLNPNLFLQILPKALKSITISPPIFTINYNPVLGQGSRQLSVIGTLNDVNGTQIDLTSASKGTTYSSSDLTVCNFGAVDGDIFAGNTGTCTITATNSGFTATATGTVTGFTPSEVATLVVPGAVAVDVAGNFAYVATGANGMSVVDITDRTNPSIIGAISGLGNAQDIKVAGQYAYIADATGFLRVVDVSKPAAPVLAGSLAITGAPIALAVHPTLALVAAQSGGISVVSVANPTAPVLMSVIPTPAPAVGVDFDLQHGLAAVAMSTAGFQLFDISNPVIPQPLGSLAGGDVRRVLFDYPALLLADVQRSVTAASIADPKNPAISSSLAANLGGRPVDIAVFGGIAITADDSFGRAIPVINVSNPLQPQSITFWRLNSPGFSSSVAMDSAFGYVTVPAISTLRIYQYQAQQQTPSQPPTASIASPTAGSTYIERQTIPVSVIAADQVAVAGVILTANGQNVATITSPPYTFSYTVPVGVPSVSFVATAVDLAGLTGNSFPVQINVIPDPGTTAIGTVVDTSGKLVAGATVSTLGGRSSTTAADGSFTITQVPTILGNVIVRATFLTSTGATLAGLSNSVAPVPLGTVNVGTITVVPVPVITLMSRKSALWGTTVTFQVTGTTLTGSTFGFQPASSPGISVTAVSIDPSGTSATLAAAIPSGVAGTFALVATNVAGSSDATITPTDRFTVVNPSSTADTDGNGFPDVIKAYYGIDILDPSAVPVILPPPEADSVMFSVLNTASPAGTGGPGTGSVEADSVLFSVLNTASPVGTGASTVEADSALFSVLNTASPTGKGASTVEADSLLFSVLNTASPSGTGTTSTVEADSVLFSVLNTSPGSITGLSAEADSILFSVENTNTGAVLHAAARPKRVSPLPAPRPSPGKAARRGAPSCTYVPLTDTTGNGYPDYLKIAQGLDPNDPNAIPNLNPPPEVESVTFSVSNWATLRLPPVSKNQRKEGENDEVRIVQARKPSFFSRLLHYLDGLAYRRRAAGPSALR